MDTNMKEVAMKEQLISYIIAVKQFMLIIMINVVDSNKMNFKHKPGG